MWLDIVALTGLDEEEDTLRLRERCVDSLIPRSANIVARSSSNTGDGVLA